MKKKNKEIPIIELSTFFSILIWVCIIAFLTLLGYGILTAFLHFMIFISPHSYTREYSPDFYPASIEILQESPTITEAKLKTYPVGCEYWNGYIENLDIERHEKDWLQHIVFCESTCNPNAVSHAGATGLMQWMPWVWNAYYPGEDINNPYLQIEKTLEKYREGRASMWCCNDLI